MRRSTRLMAAAAVASVFAVWLARAGESGFDAAEARRELEVLQEIIRTSLSQSATDDGMPARDWRFATVESMHLRGQGALLIVEAPARHRPGSVAWGAGLPRGVAPELGRAVAAEVAAHRLAEAARARDLAAARVDEARRAAEMYERAVAAAAEERARAGAVLAGEAPPSPEPGPGTHPAPPRAPGAPHPPEAAEELERALRLLDESGNEPLRERLELALEALRDRLAATRGRFGPGPGGELVPFDESSEAAAAELDAIQERLVGILARHGDSLTQVRANERITVVLRPPARGFPLGLHGAGDTRHEDRIVSLEKRTITGFKRGDLTERQLRDTAHVYKY